MSRDNSEAKESDMGSNVQFTTISTHCGNYRCVMSSAIDTLVQLPSDTGSNVQPY